MAFYFLDSSALVKHYILEQGSPWINTLFDPAHTLLIARITEVELSSALARRVRKNLLSPPDHAALMSQFSYDQANVLRIVEIDTKVCKLAAQLTLSHSLRAYDSVQLGCALTVHHLLRQIANQPLMFLASDADLLSAAQAEGLMTNNPENDEPPRL